jgi:hypothetical protein
MPEMSTISNVNPHALHAIEVAAKAMIPAPGKFRAVVWQNCKPYKVGDSDWESQEKAITAIESVKADRSSVFSGDGEIYTPFNSHRH